MDSRQIAGNHAFAKPCREAALDVLVGVAENAPGLVRKCAAFVPTVVPVCLSVSLAAPSTESP
jgi:hypothetical protein